MRGGQQDQSFLEKVTPWKSTDFKIGAGLGLAGSGTASGQFELDPENADHICRVAGEIADDFQEALQQARDLSRTPPPAQDPASLGFNRIGNQALMLGAGHVKAEYAYWRNLHESLQKALAEYREADEQAKGDITSNGGGARKGWL
ncbi:hypothetical protein BJF85_17405 [Saccharomonospora sp. CUA-673]|nr:hypothetical protein BJF85_17405 [Saccharomonospora sp. CUA-673]